MNDTTRETDNKMRELMMNRSGAERLAMASDMFDAARTLVLASLSPSLDEVELGRQLCQRFYRGEVDVGAFAAALRHKANGRVR